MWIPANCLRQFLHCSCWAEAMSPILPGESVLPRGLILVISSATTDRGFVLDLRACSPHFLQTQESHCIEGFKILFSVLPALNFSSQLIISLGFGFDSWKYCKTRWYVQSPTILNVNVSKIKLQIVFYKALFERSVSAANSDRLKQLFSFSVIQI